MATTDKPSGNEPAQSDMSRAGGMRGTMDSAVSSTEDVSRSMVGGVGNIAGGIVGVVADTANTAIDCVGSVGENAIHTAADLLSELVGGVRQIAGAAVSGMGSSGRGGRGQMASRGDQAPRRDTSGAATRL